MKKLLVGIEKLGNRGSTLIAVLVVTTILSLFIVTMQPMMLSYASRSIDERDVKQAELSAKSANDAVVQAVLDGNTTLLGVINGMTNDLDIRFLSNFRFGLDETGKDRHKTMGTIEAKILRVEANRFSVITMATVGLKTWTIARELSKTTTGGEALSGALPAYYFFTVSYTNGGGFQVSGTTPVMVNSNFSLTNKGEISVGGDLIIQDSSITFNGNPTKMQIDGNLYTTRDRKSVV